MKLNTYITTLFSAAAALLWQETTAQTNGFVQQDVIKVANITTDAQITALSTSGRQTTREYYDGLGRTLQTLAVGASPSGNDLIQPVLYNTLGQQTIGYLPYAGKSTDVQGSYRSNALSGAQGSFYNDGTQHLVASDDMPFAQQVFENSPLQRLLQVGMTGDGFQPGLGGNHYKTVNYRANNSTADGNILQWNPNGTYTTSTYYAANSLSVTDGTDEDGGETLSFTDLAGRVVLKRQKVTSGNYNDTYYIYNNAGMINYVVPPAVIPLLAANSYNLTTTPLSTLVFHFVYDTMGRLIEKTVPSKGTMYIVYDPMNRPVLLQDANLFGGNKWNYLKYDAKGRAISQGIYVDNTYTGRVNMQAHVNTLTSYSTAWFESRSGSPTLGGYYSNNIFPVTGITPLAYSYFDDYDLNMDGAADFIYSNQSLTGEVGATAAQIKGMPTMVSKTTVGNAFSSTWLTTVTFYDKRLNPIQTQSNNQVYYVGATTLTDIKTIVPDFVGVPQISRVSKKSGASTTTTVLTLFTYDQMNRPATISQQYNNSGTTLLIAAYNYNELGQMIKKNLGGTGSSGIPANVTLNSYSATTVVATNSITLNTPFAVYSGSSFNAFINNGYLQTVDYRYNIRGQLTNINNSRLSNDGGVTNNDSNDLFGMSLVYDQTDSNIGNSASFSGRISAVKWMSRDGSNNSTYERSYKYTYDAVNRLTAANYAERTTTSTGSFSNNIGGFDESGITYDKNGNILTLARNSSSPGSNANIQIDNLTYGYNAASPNQLLTVTDGTGINYTNLGFRNYTNSTGNYTYDANGNMLNDPYKGIAIDYYNVLNKVNNIAITSVGHMDYTYDAAGTVLRKRQYNNSGSLTGTTDYIDGFVFTNGILAYFAMPEGRVLYSAGTFTQEYVITDQQGNARVSFDNSGAGGTAKVKQENSYYAFGLTMANSPVYPPPPVPNKNLYNGGSELQNDYNYLPDLMQTFYRIYDATLGRWTGVDLKAEMAESMTSYQYAGNNPVMGNDPLGDKATGVDGLIDVNFAAIVQSWANWGSGGGGGGGFGRAELVNAVADMAAWETQSVGAAVSRFALQDAEIADANHIKDIASINTFFADHGMPIPFNQLPEVHIYDLRPGHYPSWWGNGQLFSGANQVGNWLSDAWSWTKNQVSSGEYDKASAGLATGADGEVIILTAIKITQRSLPKLLKPALTTTGIIGTVVSGGYSAIRLASGKGDWKDWANVGIALVNVGLLANPLVEAYAAGELLWTGAVFGFDVYQAATAK